MTRAPSCRGSIGRFLPGTAGHNVRVKPYFTLPREGGLPLFNDAHALIRFRAYAALPSLVYVLARGTDCGAQLRLLRSNRGAQTPGRKAFVPEGRPARAEFGTVGAGMQLGRSARQGVDLAPRCGNAEPSPPAIDPSHTGPTRRHITVRYVSLAHYALHEEQETTSSIFFLFSSAQVRS